MPRMSGDKIMFAEDNFVGGFIAIWLSVFDVRIIIVIFTDDNFVERFVAIWRWDFDIGDIIWGADKTFCLSLTGK